MHAQHRRRYRMALASLTALTGALGVGLSWWVVARVRERERVDVEAAPPEAVPPGYPQSALGRLYDQACTAVDRAIGWDRLPVPLGLFVLGGLRDLLRQRNLHDTSLEPGINRAPVAPPQTRNLVGRTVDGTYNDLASLAMGMVHSRFGRNVPVSRTWPDTGMILTPNPRTVSRELLTRDVFKPASTLNLLAAAWIQFMIHGWFSHGKNQKEDPWQVPLADEDPWPEHPMRILRTSADPTHPADAAAFPPTYLNATTHWWDGSQLYGCDDATLSQVRSGQDGKLNIGSDGLLPVDPTSGIDVTGVNGNWWIGLVMMHTLFTLEHNAICDRLRAAYPSWSDDDLFARARLVNTALMAKIHTVEWTPAILGHPTLHVAMNANWSGLATERIRRLFGRISSSEVISGIPGSPTDHFGVPYAITEEFVSVYRMHPLLPDRFSFRAADDDRPLQDRALPLVADRHAHELAQEVPMTDLFYSFGTSNPGAITLHNYPRFLQHREEPDGSLIDLATTEILRDRERGVPRYNEFRQLVHRRPVRSMEDISDDPATVRALRQVYGDDVDQVDLMIGLYAERPPRGFGFSDTAFRIFILMASRRLNSDRFFTADFNERTYTQPGMDWVVENGMGTILARHFPGVLPMLRTVKNPFAPWPRAS